MLKTMTAAAAATVLASGLAFAQEAQTHDFDLATSWSGGPLMEIGAQAFAERVETMSDRKSVV